FDLAHAADVEHRAERRFALAERGFVFLTLGKIVEMAYNAETAVRHGHAFYLPVVGFDCTGVFSLLDAAGRVVWLTSVERASKTVDRLAGERLGPNTPQCLGQVAADQRLHVLECLLRAGADLHDMKVGIHRVDAERRILDELTKRNFAGAQTLLRAFEAG